MKTNTNFSRDKLKIVKTSRILDINRHLISRYPVTSQEYNVYTINETRQLGGAPVIQSYDRQSDKYLR